MTRDPRWLDFGFVAGYEDVVFRMVSNGTRRGLLGRWGAPSVWLGVGVVFGVVLLVLLVGGGSGAFVALEEDESSAVDVSPSADATVGRVESVSRVSAGGAEIEPLGRAESVSRVSAGGAEVEPLVVGDGSGDGPVELVKEGNLDGGVAGDGGDVKEASALRDLLVQASGESYTWWDGDREIAMQLQVDVVLVDGEVVPVVDVVPDSAQSQYVGGQSQEGVVGSGDVAPVFRSDEGELMALPGGVVVVLDPGWDYAAVDEFFERNGVTLSRVTDLDYVTNGFFIETEPGFASLDLANALVGQAGVELSSPNWWKEVFTD